MTERVNPFGDLGDFSPTPAKPKVEHLNVANEVAAVNGFTSRQPTRSAISVKHTQEKEKLPSRRRSTGRSEQVNIKTTFAAKKRLMEISVERDMPLGEILELAIEALEKSWLKDI